jgi:uncharacterized alkaline shock family protein YloU
MAEGPKPEAEAGSGGVTIADSVVAKVAHTACRDIAGVHALGGATSRALSSLRGGGESRTQGVSVDLRDDGVDLDITLVVMYGVNIPQVAEECRKAVKEQVEGSTGLTVRAVNVVVSDIYFPEAPAEGGGAQA